MGNYFWKPTNTFRKFLGFVVCFFKLRKRNKLEGLKGRHVHKAMSKMAKKGIARNKQKELLQGRRITH